jgi:hypothetical protein
MKRMESYQNLVDTFSVILRRISLTLVGKSTIPFLIKAIQAGRKEISTYRASFTLLGGAAETLLKTVAVQFPGVYRNNLSDFVSLLTSDDESLGTRYSLFLRSILNEELLLTSRGCIGRFG